MKSTVSEITGQPGPGLITQHLDGVFLLNPNGTYIPLLGDSAKGMWGYQLLNEKSARLQLGQLVITLTFIGETSGTFEDRFPRRDAVFEIIPSTPRSRLINSSNLVFLPLGETLTTGFVLSSPTIVLIRAVGPGLAPFGVLAPMRQPRVRVYRVGTDIPLSESNNWAVGDTIRISEIENSSAAVGAFPLNRMSADAAVVKWLEAGQYIVEVSSITPAEGRLLLELYVFP